MLYAITIKYIIKKDSASHSQLNKTQSIPPAVLAQYKKGTNVPIPVNDNKTLQESRKLQNSHILTPRIYKTINNPPLPVHLSLSTPWMGTVLSNNCIHPMEILPHPMSRQGQKTVSPCQTSATRALINKWETHHWSLCDFS